MKGFLGQPLELVIAETCLGAIFILMIIFHFKFVVLLLLIALTILSATVVYENFYSYMLQRKRTKQPTQQKGLDLNS